MEAGYQSKEKEQEQKLPEHSKWRKRKERLKWKNIKKQKNISMKTELGMPKIK